MNASTTLFLLPSVFIDAGDNLVMADDVATPLNPPVTTVDKEELEEATLNGTLFYEVALDETPFDEVTFEVNVSQ